MKLREDFEWGVATSAYQIEGAYNENGKGRSIWDAYSNVKGNICSDHNGNIACDHYHKFKEDVALMKQMGIKAYRFSIAWTRIIPDGIGQLNKDGIRFYNELIDELLKNEIEPYITLYHWDLPLELHYKGDWLNREIADWFAEYAKVVVVNFSDRVKKFITINEPQCIIGHGYGTGINAPGLKLSKEEMIVASHNLMLAHGKAVIAMRKYGANDIEIGFAPTGSGAYPHTETENDINAAKEKFFEVEENSWDWSISWFSDPIFSGKYPEDGLKVLGKYLPKSWKSDLEIIHQCLDFLCINLYNGKEYEKTENGIKVVERYEGFPRTAMNWPVTPEALNWSLKFLYERYNLPIYVSENGISCCDVISLDGKVHDSNRIDFINRYLLELKKAIKAGVDIRGYFYWSFMDNFEWGYGYKERFGLVYVDYRTQKRIIKDSGYWYKEVIKNKGENLFDRKKANL